MFEIDDADAAPVSGKRWRSMLVGNLVYAATGVGTLMHRVITGAAKGESVDHVDGNAQNNRRANLRICTHAENMQNRTVSKASTTGVRNVMREVHRGREYWRVAIGANGVRHRKLFRVFQDAVAYAEKMRPVIQGEFAPESARLVRLVHAANCSAPL